MDNYCQEMGFIKGNTNSWRIINTKGKILKKNIKKVSSNWTSILKEILRKEGKEI